MSLKPKRQVQNRLALFRRRKLLKPKQVARLLGHKSTEQLSRYENGFKVPNLRTALKLASIYEVPIREMLDEYYAACLEEIRRENETTELLSRKISVKD